MCGSACVGEAHGLMGPVWLYHACIVPNMQVIVGGYYLGDGKTCLRADSNLYTGNCATQCGHTSYLFICMQIVLLPGAW